jgi:hypothetical protein
MRIPVRKTATLMTRYNYFRKFHFQLHLGTVLQCTGYSLLFGDKRLRIAETEIEKAHDTLLLSKPGKGGGGGLNVRVDLGKGDVRRRRAERTRFKISLNKNGNSLNMYILQDQL